MADRKQSGNWNLWQDIPQAEIWEWVALSLNIEPKNLRGLDFRPIGGGPFDDCPAEFQGRLTKAVAHIEAGTLAVKRPGYSSWQDIVEKNIFVTWASNELKWKLPPDMVAMTQKQDESETAPAESKLQSQTPAELRKNHDITRERGCRRLILEHWDDIEKLHGPNANGRQARIYILKEIDASESKPVLKTVQNKLAELRGEKLIP